jgi:hypothetical protein
MELKLVEQLLEKYFQGETTIAEEKQLKAYFSTNDVAPHLARYHALFGYFETQKVKQFEQKLPLQHKKQRTVTWIGIVASFVVLFGLASFYFYSYEPKYEDLGTYNSPEDAFAATQKALLMVSEQVNIGMESVVYLEEYEKTKKTIFKSKK